MGRLDRFRGSGILKAFNMPEIYDAAICGAGPAGCSAALALGKSGFKVVLIEKDHFPREKPCGDALPAYVPKVLESIDPSFAEAFLGIAEKNNINTCRVSSPSRKIVDIRFRENGYVIRRSVFDNFMAGLAGSLSNVEIRQGVAVTGIHIDKNLVTVTAGNNFELKARLLIGCDGARSIAAAELIKGKPGEGITSVAVRGYFRNVKGLTPGTIEIHFMKNLLPGYFWIFPLDENTCNAGLGVMASDSRRINLRKELYRIMNEEPDMRERFAGSEPEGDLKGHILPLFTGKKIISGYRFMLCGDAASTVNPATGAGAGQAMQTGRYAGWQAAKCLLKDDFSEDFMRSYDRTVHEKLWVENRKYLFILEHILRHEKRLNLAVGLAARSMAVSRIIGTILA